MFAASKTAGAVSAVVNYIEDVFSTYLYTGNGGSQTITNNIDLSTKGGLVWIKSRNTGALSGRHWLTDTARGVDSYLETNSGSSAASGGVQTFNTNGFSLTGGTGINWSGDTFVSWTFRKQPKFFDIVTYTGNGANRTIAHNLGSVPGCIIVKRTESVGSWQVYHRSLANTEYLVLDSDAAKATGATRWNSTTPTSTVFSLGTDATVNASSGSYVAYIFAHEAGGFGLTGTDSVISCGSFTSNVSGNGATITLPWEPQFLITKNTQSAHDWKTVDATRIWSQSGYVYVYPNATDAEYTTTQTAALSPSGVVYPSGGFINNNTQIYIAIRRGPMKVPTSGTSVFAPLAFTGATTNTINLGKPADFVWIGQTNYAAGDVFTRLIGNKYLNFTLKDAEAAPASPSGVLFDNSSGATQYDWYNQSGASVIDYAFGRAPSFFDVVCYTGNGTSGTQITHSLTVAPELIIVKERSTASTNVGWPVWSNQLSAGNYYLRLNQTTQEDAYAGFFTASGPTPTATTFTIGNDSDVNTSSQTYVAYLFATCPGVSKTGKYTGNGTTQTIDCGFTGGARFVLIKRINSTSDWYVYDTARGMTTLTDPYLRFNVASAQTATLGSVTTVSTGFALNSAILAAINVSGGTYLFLAIA
jgi:hypothetical protein